MELCKNCQKIPELYEVDPCKEDLLEAVERLMSDNEIRTTMTYDDECRCPDCGALYHLLIYTEVFKVEFTLKRSSTS